MSETAPDSSKPAVALARIEESIRHGDALVDGLSSYFGDSASNTAGTVELADTYKRRIRQMHIDMVRNALAETVALRAGETQAQLALSQTQLEQAQADVEQAELLRQQLQPNTPDVPAATASQAVGRVGLKRATVAGAKGGKTRRHTQTAAIRASQKAWQEGLAENLPIPEGEIPPVSILLRTTMGTDVNETSYEDTRTLVAAAAVREPNLFSDDEGAILSPRLRATVRAVNTIRSHLADVDSQHAIIEIPQDDQGRTRAISFLNPSLLEAHPPQLVATPDFGPTGSVILGNFVEAMTQPAPNLNELPVHPYVRTSAN